MENDARGLKKVHRPRRKSQRERGYGTGHRVRRRLLAPLVAEGLARCSRCGELIEAGTPWDLGHDDYDRSIYSGRSMRAVTVPHRIACVPRGLGSRDGKRAQSRRASGRTSLPLTAASRVASMPCTV